VPWSALAAINAIETNYGRDLGSDLSQQLGWMKLTADVSRRYAVSGTGRGSSVPHDPADAIFTAAHYLAANGAARDLVRAIYAYHPQEWYVAAVLWRAANIARQQVSRASIERDVQSLGGDNHASRATQGGFPAPASSISLRTAVSTTASRGRVTSRWLTGALMYSADGAGGVITPNASWNPQRKPLAAWIAPILQWASQHGWTGTLTSGYRTFNEQSAINAAGLFSAPAGTSNHETSTYPGGAVDVTEPAVLAAVLQGYTGARRLIGGVLGPADPEHFSATGR
jgi:hypothetical protein